MSCDKWFYRADICEGRVCPGDCDLCDIPKNPELYIPGFEDAIAGSVADDEEDEKMQIIAARKGEE